LRTRAARLDESLQVLTRLWSGGPVSYRGRYLTVDGVRMVPGPVQRPRIPVWCAGRWPGRAGFRRAARWDGAMPTFADYGRERAVPPEELAAVVEFLRAERGSLDGFDIVMPGWSPRQDPAVYAPAGVVSRCSAGQRRRSRAWSVQKHRITSYGPRPARRANRTPGGNPSSANPSGAPSSSTALSGAMPSLRTSGVPEYPAIHLYS